MRTCNVCGQELGPHHLDVEHISGVIQVCEDCVIKNQRGEE